MKTSVAELRIEIWLFGRKDDVEREKEGRLVDELRLFGGRATEVEDDLGSPCRLSLRSGR